jgi:hypothetical protein
MTVIDPTGINIKIPVWMTRPEAAEFKLSKIAGIKADFLLELANLLELIKKDNTIAR